MGDVTSLAGDFCDSESDWGGETGVEEAGCVAGEARSGLEGWERIGSWPLCNTNNIPPRLYHGYKYKQHASYRIILYKSTCLCLRKTRFFFMKGRGVKLYF